VRRFRVGSLEPDDAGLLHVEPAVWRHLRVLRSTRGDVVCLFDGFGGEVEAEIVAIDDLGASLRPLGSIHRQVESELDSCLVQAVPARWTRMDTIVRQVTEIGVRRVVPVLAERSQQARASAAALERRTERWRRVADAAAEQSRRTRVPAIDAPVPFKSLAWTSLPRPMFVANVGAMASDDVPPAKAVTILVGPEGGWSGEEIERATAQGAYTLYLGPRVLRADTAGAVALALFQYRWGDLAER
jgi:16S rRNA (uracil1498-N3)-methyltransferase